MHYNDLMYAMHFLLITNLKDIFKKTYLKSSNFSFNQILDFTDFLISTTEC